MEITSICKENYPISSFPQRKLKKNKEENYNF